MILSPDGEGGWSQTLLAKEGDVLAGQTKGVADFGTGPHSYAFSNTGDVFFFADLNGDTTRDGVMYLGTPGGVSVVARSLSRQESTGRNFLTLSSKAVDMNNAAGTGRRSCSARRWTATRRPTRCC